MRRRDFLRGAAALLTCAAPVALLEGPAPNVIRAGSVRGKSLSSIGVDHAGGLPDYSAVLVQEETDRIWRAWARRARWPQRYVLLNANGRKLDEGVWP